MNKTSDIYEKLANHLDHLPGGYPSTPSGVELKILKKLFTLEEASLAVHLTLLDETSKVVAYRAGIPASHAERLLWEMAGKGLIFYTPEPDGSQIYMAAQFVVGIWEMQLGFLDEELTVLFEEYRPSLFKENEWREIPQLRTIPVEEAIDSDLKVLPYERAIELIKNKTNFVVAPCICRLEKGIGGEACKKPLETCISFGEEADFYTSSGFGRQSTLDEVLEILAIAEKKGLVIQPSNGKEIKWICCCCGCCCGVLRTIRSFSKPSELTSSAFTLAVDADLCDGCKICVKRCQMYAMTVPEVKVVWDEDRCIGCGLCVTTCKTGALQLVRKPESDQPKIPKDIVDASIKTLKMRGKARLTDLALMVLRSKRDRIRARNHQ
jgi:H+/Na+-translocating ferredoxin:NAD+ oxidoreductase subunit B